MLQCAGSERRSVSYVREKPFCVSEAQGHRGITLRRTRKQFRRTFEFFRLAVHEAYRYLRMENDVNDEE